MYNIPHLLKPNQFNTIFSIKNQKVKLTIFEMVISSMIYHECIITWFKDNNLNSRKRHFSKKKNVLKFLFEKCIHPII